MLLRHWSWWICQFSILSNLINYTQEACGIPWDRTPPCPPELSVESDCVAGENTLTWNDPNNSCADDVVKYYVYYSALESENPEDFVRIDSLFSAFDTVVTYSDLPSVAGCYAVTAVDSLLVTPEGNLNQNESDFSNIVCVENCPAFELPNVFTPNNDGINDKLIPVISRQIDDLKLTIFNRWGTIVFETDNLEVEWDGTDINSKKPLSDGVYFYVADYQIITLTGNQPDKTSGYIYIFKDASKNSN